MRVARGVGRHWMPVWAGWLCALSLVLTACAPGDASNLRGQTVPTPAPLICADAGCAARGVRVYVEPDAGEAPITQAIAGATRSIWVEVYLLSDRTVIRALEDAAARGLDVRVLLELHPFGDGQVSAQRILEELSAAGVRARASSPAFTFTHEKALVVDGATAYILTSNLSRAGLGGNGTTANREYGVIDTDAGDVADVREVFLADWERRAPALRQARLVVSPVNARPELAALMDGAARGLRLEDEEMFDARSEDRLIAAARRGVDVRVVLPAPGTGAPDSAADVARLVRGGVRVRYLTAPYMHAKLLLTDDRLAFVGSENFSATSLESNRELGIVLADPTGLGTLSGTFEQDWVLATDAA